MYTRYSLTIIDAYRYFRMLFLPERFLQMKFVKKRYQKKVRMFALEKSRTTCEYGELFYTKSELDVLSSLNQNVL